jgi:hypothetical protein
MGINVEGFTRRRHRTALFVDAAKARTDSQYRERTNRLIESLNKPGNSPSGTIKVDVFEVDGTTVRPRGYSGYSQQSPATSEALQRWAREQGYTQALVSMPGADRGW